MPILNVVGQEIEPPKNEHASLRQRFDLKVELRTAIQLGATRGGAAPVPVEAADDDLIELEYSNGVREWLTAGDLRTRYASPARARGAADTITIEARPPSAAATRGGLDVVLKVLKVLDLDPTEPLADLGVKAAIEHFEGRLEPGSGLYRLDRDGNLADLVTGELARRMDPYLLLLHGTFSSTGATFQKLFASREWSDLWTQYDGRILGFNHPTLSASPIDNALELVGHLPHEARLHIVSHSRGGLVGELLCLDAVTRDDLDYFDKAERAADIATLQRLAEQLVARKLDVRRFVRVACPARGTLLASQRLDLYLSVMLNLIGLIPGLAENVIYDFAKATILTLIKKRAKAKDLPGLEAMIPESPLVGMLNRPGRKSTSDLAVVAGDVVAGGGVWNTLKTWASDAFYWQDHDLVVHTRAMYGGLERPPSAVYYFRTAPDMNHFNYFANDESRSRIYRWLTQKPGEAPEEFHSLAMVRARARTRTRAALPADAPAVVLIPGVFASHLTAGSQRIWIDLENLAVGKLDRLALAAEAGKRQPAVKPDGIVEDHFADLVADFSTRFQVLPCAYDWRHSLRVEVNTLAATVEQALQGNRKVYLLAHSSGGLLARALLAYHRELWDRLCARGGRLVMLGAPNHGTHAMVELLSGQADLTRMLDLLDSKHSLAEICGQLRRYPGLVELLPPDARGWKKPFLATLAAEEKADCERLLAASRQVWQALHTAVDPAHMCYVAGSAPGTVAGVRAGEEKTLRFEMSNAGDGFVTHELGRLDGVPTWYMDAAHGDLANRAEHFEALAELLIDGKTARLKQEPPPPPAPEAPTQRQVRLVLYPNQEEFVAAALGGTAPRRTAGAGAGAAAGAAVTLAVSVLHASLEHASYPLAIGHYDGDMIVGAEAVLDGKLDGRLAQRRLMNLYPGEVGTVEVLLNPQGTIQGEAKGALVIGLGEVGQITQDIVTRGVAEAALRLALARLDARDTAPAGATAAPGDRLPRRRESAAFSTLLVGTRGGRALSIDSAVAAVVTGALLANRVLAQGELLDQVCVDAVEFVEIYGDLAMRAAHAVNRVKQNLRITLTDGEAVAPEPFLRRGEGGYTGQPPSDYDAGWWRRVQIKETTDPRTGRCGGELQFLQSSDRARAELVLQATQRALVERLVEKTIHEATTNLELPATLYELLLPNELKEQPLESSNLLLVLDAPAAQYPWEMLAERQVGPANVGDEPLLPLAVRMGMVRQLETTRFRSHVQAPRSKNALVIGEPKLADPSYPPLAGARTEAATVANVLRSFDYEVSELIQADALTIINALYAQEYRIIHIAGHGIYEPDCPAQSGVVLGNNTFLTAAEIGQLRVVPEMVFLNCCHLGVVDAEATAQQTAGQLGTRAWNKLAASVSTRLIEIGVRAVVAAGWAVNDAAAALFAETLYRRMLSGDVAQFGDAVRAARQAIFESHRSCNTWGAYQCYGDPGFLLHAGSGRAAAPPKSYVASQEFILDLKNLQSRASRTTAKSWITRYRNELHRLEARLGDDLPARWRNGEMLTELGDTYAELGDFEEAILRYREALGASSPLERVPIRSVEQLANLEARFAVRLSLAETQGETQRETQRETQARADGWSVDDLMKLAQRRLELLLELTPTAERYALLGSYYKRRAITQRADVDKRNAALKRAEESYDEALRQRKDTEKPYHALNGIVCRYLRDMQFTEQERQNTLTAIAGVEAEILNLREADLSFWDRIVRPDGALVRALVNLTQGQFETDEPLLLDLYRREFELGATSRQRSTVLEQLEFMAVILQAKGEASAAAAVERLWKDLAS